MSRQRTIKTPVELEGIGLQTGVKTKATLKGSPANSGINFIRTDLPGRPVINIGSLSFDDAAKRKRRTTVKAGTAEVQTTEHLLAAISGLGIDNIIVEVDSKELPGLDGSALGYVEALERSGIVEQDEPSRALSIERPVYCAHKDAFLSAFPYDRLRISYFLSYPVRSIGQQFFDIEITGPAFKRDIAPARTFCNAREAIFLLAMGLGKGANKKNTLIMGRDGPAGNELRFPDEPVRHKILDLLGDLCLAGQGLKAHVVAVKSGHRLNLELVRQLKKIQKS